MDTGQCEAASPAPARMTRKRARAATLLLLAAVGCGGGRGRGAIAVGEWDDTRRTQIFSRSPDGGARRQLTTGPEEHWMPAWSPDGRRLACVARTPRGMNLEVMDADGANRRTLTGAGLAMAPSWSPDGQGLAYGYTDVPGTALKICWAGVEATDPRPDLPRDVWVTSADGTNPRRLAHGDDPAWSPDGALIVYPAVWSPDGRIGVGAIAPDGTNPRVLFFASGDFGRMSWQPIGR